MTALSTWPPALAASESALGQLQRGHGAVARRVLRGELAGASEMVIDCIRTDPRWDSQLDSRAEYYAAMTESLGISVAAIVDLIRADEAVAVDSDPGSSLALAVLLVRATQSDDAAVDAARSYVGWGRYWDEAVDGLAYGTAGIEPLPDWRRRVDGVAKTINDRWRESDALAAALGDYAAADPRRTPWREWADEDATLGDALRVIDSSRETGRTAREHIRGRPTEELLALTESGYLTVVAGKLATRTNKRDVDAMLIVAADPSVPMCAAAVCALAAQGHVEVLPTILALSEGPLSRAARVLLARAFRGLSYDVTRPIALDWIASDDPWRRRAAAAAIEEHAMAADVPLVRRLLTHELDAELEGDQYRVCSYATALARHSDLGPYPELDRAFDEMPYSYGRHFVVDALARTDAGFAAARAVECLWDSEAVIRETAAQELDHTVAGVAARLAELAADQAEEHSVRAAARGTPAVPSPSRGTLAE